MGGVVGLSMAFCTQVCKFDLSPSRWISLMQKIDSGHVSSDVSLWGRNWASKLLAVIGIAEVVPHSKVIPAPGECTRSGKLIASNSLYKDVTIDQNVVINEEDTKRGGEEAPGQRWLRRPMANLQRAYLRINDFSRIVRASWHQANDRVFISGFAGVQCCAMVLANILRAYIPSPKHWSTNELNLNMNQARKSAVIDSHSCGPKSANASDNEKAYIIECDNLDEFVRICKCTTGSKNVQLTLDYVDVEICDIPDSSEPETQTRRQNIERVVTEKQLLFRRN
ncbi:uncharacterized protein TNCV_763441 [Trichonephila clavipes]|nr:uncharacterized protein TNCV_763441 [Trichonephila clavipes]